MRGTPENRALCEHVQPGTWPFLVRLALDEHLGFTDALVACRHCGATYLLEMLDWLDQDRVMRVSLPPADRTDSVIHDIERGSCDLTRAGREIHHLRTSTPLCRLLLLVDWRGPTITAIVDAPSQERLPGVSWRELPCDGSWVRYARSNTEIVNPKA
jgi:hypothetical protein